jgi:hypothetical protein
MLVDGLHWAVLDDRNSYLLCKMDVADFEAISDWSIRPGKCKRLKIKFLQKRKKAS